MIAITQLPRIVERLHVNGEPQFVVLLYDEFVRLAAAVSGHSVPDIVAILDHGAEHVFVIITSDHHRMFIDMLNISGEIDEMHYLNKYEDIKVAIDQGRLRSGTQHYMAQGYFERREVRFPAAG